VVRSRGAELSVAAVYVALFAFGLWHVGACLAEC